MAKSKLSPEDVVANIFKPRIDNNQQPTEASTDPLGHCIIPRVNIDQLTPYDNNPRESDNPRYYEIKESIRNQGLRDKFSLTRRNPDDEKFMIRDGGNTRLNILRELWEETQEERFYWLENLEFFPWISEVDALAGHMSENENRGSLLFIERARAAVRFKDMFEEDAGKPLTNKALVDLICASGWTIDEPALGRYLFTAKHLESNLQTLLWDGGMGHPAVVKIRAIYRRYLKLCRDKDIGDDEFSALLGMALKTVDEEYAEIGFTPDAEFLLIDQLDKNIAGVLGVDDGEVNHLANAFVPGANAPDNKAQILAGSAALAPQRDDDDEDDEFITGGPVPRETSEQQVEASLPPQPGTGQQPESSGLPRAAKSRPLQPSTGGAAAQADSAADAPLEPTEALLRIKQLQVENRKLARRLINRMELPTDVFDIDEGMGFVLTECRAPIKFGDDETRTCVGCAALLGFKKVAGMALALHFLETGKTLPDQYRPEHIIKNVFADDIAPPEILFMATDLTVYKQRGMAILGKPVDSIYTSVIDDMLTPLENNFYSICEYGRAAGWRQG